MDQGDDPCSPPLLTVPDGGHPAPLDQLLLHLGKHDEKKEKQHPE
jgi:hypothetical protein